MPQKKIQNKRIQSGGQAFCKTQNDNMQMSKLIFKKCKIECVSAKSTRKYYTFSTPNNLKIKRSFELSSCSKKTKK